MMLASLTSSFFLLRICIVCIITINVYSSEVVSLSDYHQLREETDKLMEELAAEKKKVLLPCGHN